jgi:DNA-binding LacI/PurR family transcriptional regulator
MASRAGGRPTLSDVARHSGVSTAAVSYVLNNRPDKPISETTRQRVLEAAAQLGYTPNAAAATLRRGHSQIVLVVIDPTYAGDVSARTVEHVTAGIASRGYTVLVHVKISEPQLCDVVAALQPFGVLLLTFTSAATRAQLSALGARHVLGLTHTADDAEPARFWELQLGAAQVRHLADLGHKRIAFALPTDDSPRAPVARSRLAGAAAEAHRRGLGQLLATPLALDRAAVAHQLASWREEGGVTAVCAHDDRMGIAVLAATADLDWSVPGDLAVIGADNNPESQLTTPALSTVWIPEAQYGAYAEEWLTAAIEGRSPDALEVIDTGEPLVEVTRRHTT